MSHKKLSDICKENESLKKQVDKFSSLFEEAEMERKIVEFKRKVARSP